MQITLPNPCPVCEGPVTYSGRGRRPDYCSRKCSNVQRAEDMRSRRARERGDVAPADPLLKALAERRRQRIAAEPYVAVLRAHDEHMIMAAQIAAEAAGEGRAMDGGAWLPESEDGYWAERTALPRHADPAAQWLAANHPEELANFPPACRPA